MQRIQVTTHDGKGDKEIVVQKHDADELISKLNDDSISHVLIGDEIYSRIDIKNILTIENTEVTI